MNSYIGIRKDYSSALQKKSLKCIFLSLVLAFACAVGMSALSPNARACSVMMNTSPSSLYSNISYCINDFSETTEGWDCSDARVNVTVSEKIKPSPYTPFNGDGCLAVRTSSVYTGEWVNVTRTFASPLDLSSANSLFFAVNCPINEWAEYTVSLQLISDRRSVTYETEITPDCWNGIFADISDVAWRAEIKQMKLGFKCEVPKGQSSPEYYVDSICASEKADIMSALKYLSDAYYPERCGVTYTDGVMKLDVLEPFPAISSETLPRAAFEKANAVKIKFKSSEKCSGVRLDILSESGSFSSFSETTYETGINTCYLSLKGCIPSKLTFTFEGVGAGSIEIQGITPESAYIADAGGIGSVDTCVASPDTHEIIIRGKLNNSSYSMYSQSKLRLYALDFYEDYDPETLAKAAYITETSVSSADFTFRVKPEKDADLFSSIYKKYIIAVCSGDEVIPIGSPKCITNPEAFASGGAVYREPKNKKGMINASVYDIREYGVSETAVYVDAGRFFMYSESSNSSFTSGNTVYYYNREYADSLDSQIRSYTENNVNVTLVLTVSYTGNEALNKILVHPDAMSEANSCAFNTRSASGIAYLRAIGEFLADRYCTSDKTNGNVCGIVVGNCVGNARLNYNMGEKLLDEYVRDYAYALRTVYYAFASRSSAVRIYTYIDSQWDEELPFDLYSRYDNRSFIESLNAVICDVGNFGWALAQNPYPPGNDKYYSFSDTSLTSDSETDAVSLKNLEVITEYMSLSRFSVAGAQRKIILLEETHFGHGASDEMITADYIMGYFKVMHLPISAYITDRKANYEKVLRYSDTDRALRNANFALGVLGYGEWESAIKDFSVDKLAVRSISEGTFLSKLSEVKGEVVLSDFAHGSDGWLDYSGEHMPKHGVTFVEKSDLLSVSAGNLSGGKRGGIVKYYADSRDFSLTPLLSFDAYVASLPSGVDRATLSVTLVSENDSMEISGIVKKDAWNSVICDFSEFSGIKNITEVRILLYAGEGAYDNHTQFFITQIEGKSREYGSDYIYNALYPQQENSDVWYAVIIVSLVLAVISAFVALGYRYYKRKKLFSDADE